MEKSSKQEYSKWLEFESKKPIKNSSVKQYVDFIQNSKFLSFAMSSEELMKIIEEKKLSKGLGKNQKSFLNKFLEFKGISKIRKKYDRRQNIEVVAIDFVTEYYLKKDFEVFSLESENAGFDLLVRNEKGEYHIEVKGLSGNGKTISLTPNEYDYSKKESNSFRLCFVNNALNSRKRNVKIFRYNSKDKYWENEHNKKEILKIEEKVSANFTIIDR